VNQRDRIAQLEERMAVVDQNVDEARRLLEHAEEGLALLEGGHVPSHLVAAARELARHEIRSALKLLRDDE
jgi:hypothetical protein